MSKYKYSKKISLGYAPDGRRIRKTVHGNSNAELQRNIAKEYALFEQQINPTDISFGKYKEKWFETYKAKKSDNTKQMYKYALQKTDSLDMVRMRKITKTDLQAIVNDYDGRTAQILVMTINQICHAAHEDGILVKEIHLSQADYKAAEKRILTEEELQKVKDADLDPDERLFVDILRIFGLRPGEALALRYTDFDFKKKVLHIRNSLAFNGNSPVLKTTKTDICRELPLPDSFMPKIKKYFEENRSFYLFHKGDNSLMTKSSYRRFSERILRKIDIDDITFYSFRHTRATELYYECQKGTISTKKAAALMGHSEQIFLCTYSHIDDSKENLQSLYENIV